METAIADWLDAQPDHPDAPGVAATAHRIKMMLDFGADYLGFGLYLFSKELRPPAERAPGEVPSALPAEHRPCDQAASDRPLLCIT